jgi:hypothetical protein
MILLLLDMMDDSFESLRPRWRPTLSARQFKSLFAIR